ncbi:MAG: hypothetical protein EXS17_02425 [Phycisphaerales bacterium]|nr:hypothetical protein [Phycisphaerales bacterium]
MTRLARGVWVFCAALATIAAIRCAALPRESPHPQAKRTITREEFIDLAPGIRVNRTRNEVIIRAQVAARIGWMEQIVCKAGTREHESLLVVEVAPRIIHAALLALGCEPGSPGTWQESSPENDGVSAFELKPPTGSRLDVLVRYTRDGALIEVPVSDWLRSESPSGESIAFSRDRFVFAGSHVRPNPPSLGPGEHYVADHTGSVVGLVTFGDEVIALADVIPDRVEVAPALWEAYTQQIPPEGTDVELIIRPIVAPPR